MADTREDDTRLKIKREMKHYEATACRKRGIGSSWLPTREYFKKYNLGKEMYEEDDDSE